MDIHVTILNMDTQKTTTTKSTAKSPPKNTLKNTVTVKNGAVKNGVDVASLPPGLNEIPRLIERLHRHFLDVVRVNLNRLGIDDITPVQYMMLSNISNEISVRDLIGRGHYLASSASYNLKHLVDQGYVERQAWERDKRSARLRLSEKGLELCQNMKGLEVRLASSLADALGEVHEVEITYRTLRRLERRWSDAVHYIDPLDDD
ncbi:MAG: MarR family winged helix-turn-helix transcriptional regulator [Alphaproteobacteria bacterium]